MEKPNFRIPVIGKLGFSIPMFGNATILNSNGSKSQNQEFQCLEELNSRAPVFGKA